METPKRVWNALHLKWLCIYFPGIVVESMWQQRLLKLSAERKAILGSRIMLVINGQNGWNLEDVLLEENAKVAGLLQNAAEQIKASWKRPKLKRKNS